MDFHIKQDKAGLQSTDSLTDLWQESLNSDGQHMFKKNFTQIHVLKTYNHLNSLNISF
jgi:hypothetical protein